MVLFQTESRPSRERRFRGSDTCHTTTKSRVSGQTVGGLMGATDTTIVILDGRYCSDTTTPQQRTGTTAPYTDTLLILSY